MEPVLGLVPDGRALAVEHVLCDLLAVVRREAVEDDRPLAGEGDHVGVDPEAGEVGEPLVALLVLAHARPHVGVEDVGAGRRRARVVRQLDGGAAGLGRGAGPTDDLLGGLVAGRRGGHEVHAELGAGHHQRVAHVVPVAEVRDADALEAAQPLPDREHVGERLARVELVREAVDDRDVGVLGELVHVGLRERPDHDRVQVAREHDRGVLDRLPTPELQVAGPEVEPGAAELRDPDLEAHARPRGRLVEDHAEAPAVEEPVRHTLALPRLEALGVVEDEHELVALPVVDPEEVASFQVRGDHLANPTERGRPTLRYRCVTR